LTSLLHRLAVVQKASRNNGGIQGQRVLNVRIIFRGGTSEIAWVGTVTGSRSAVAAVVHAGSTVAGQRGLGGSLGIGRRSLVL